jgi:hypothetical protein
MESRMRRGLSVGATKDIHEQVRRKAIADVSREVKVFLRNFAVFAAIGNLPGQRVDANVNGLGEGWTPLNVMVADQTECASLGEDRNVVVDWTIAESESEARSDAMTLNDLGHIASGDTDALERFQCDEAMRGTLWVADGDGVSVQVRTKQDGCKHEA